MLEQETFGLLGGDSRQAALAASLAQDGHSVFAWGLEGLPAAPGVQNLSLIHICEVWALFQPHTYSRTYLLLDDFAKALTIPDHVVPVSYTHLP